MSSQNFDGLIAYLDRSVVPLLERYVIAAESGFKNASHSSPNKSTDKQDAISRTVSQMLAWVELTGVTSQKELAAHFGMSQSGLQNKNYEDVRNAVKLNKDVRRQALATRHIVSDDFTDEVLDE